VSESNGVVVLEQLHSTRHSFSNARGAVAIQQFNQSPSPAIAFNDLAPYSVPRKLDSTIRW